MPRTYLGAVTLFFVPLIRPYNWDIAWWIINWKVGILWNIDEDAHILTAILASIPCSLGIDPIRSFRLITTPFEPILVSGAYKLVSRNAGSLQMRALSNLFHPINQGLASSRLPWRAMSG